VLVVGWVFVDFVEKLAECGWRTIDVVTSVAMTYEVAHDQIIAPAIDTPSTSNAPGDDRRPRAELWTSTTM
jgi:hypothetical protein